ncbi:MAG TPA: GYD domain-containing protein [candidate division Zixibacteria bacterium]|nr:GYD domain-containing protein [candidate division Zixibacteria bacterium]MDD4918819.1 GYD domain-containing protein [candidate division Zixibacteria bacterium]MDM7973624.1 GYD domain-containing protein [candidate division Zixibacteria bacterium]HOD66492.1 GYD domain-containing protein [candidate division Zixibacteria bacterium]HOZ06966.1 GYD domain-containing protein [candidate division Zixibacteria bacterium]
MKTFFLFTKLAPSDGKRMRERQSLGRAWLHEVKEKCPDVKFLSHYALLGDYDFVDIYEAPDEETAMKVSMISMDKGAFQAKSVLAIPYARLVELANEL